MKGWAKCGFIRCCFFLVIVVVSILVYADCTARADDPHDVASRALEAYRNRPPSELSKLIYLMDRFKDTDIRVVYDGNEYDSRQAAHYAKKYLAQNYHKKQEAAKWLKIHAYRSSPAGQIIYFKYADGRSRMLIDVLLEELRLLEETVSRAL